MTDEEKSALDIIYLLPSILKKLESKIDVIDNNVKILNNKIIKLSQEKKDSRPQQDHIQTPIKTVEEKIIYQPRAEAPDTVPTSVQAKQEVKTQQPTKFILGNKKVYGHIKTTSMKPVVGATIKIFDSTNSLVRETNSDKDGYWESRLPSGKFSSEILIGGLKPINRSFELLNDTKEFELK
jgi:hypothetical protein